jgi:hypothetical protein
MLPSLPLPLLLLLPLPLPQPLPPPLLSFYRNLLLSSYFPTPLLLFSSFSILHPYTGTEGGGFNADEWFSVKPSLKETHPLINLPYVIDGDVVVTQVLYMLCTIHYILYTICVCMCVEPSLKETHPLINLPYIKDGDVIVTQVCIYVYVCMSV